MRLILTANLVLNSCCVFSQGQMDSLVIGDYKFPLKSSYKFYDQTQPGPVMVISEYEEVENERIINYRYFDKQEYNIRQEVIYITSDVTMTDSTRHPLIRVNNIIDTVLLRNEQLEFSPFIMGKKEKYFVCGVTMYRWRNDTLTKSTLASTSDPLKLEWNKEIYMPQGKPGDIFILNKLYYRKGDATFYLDRSLVIKII